MRRAKPAVYAFKVFRHQSGEYRWRLVIHGSIVVFESIQGFTTKLSASSAAQDARARIFDAAVVILVDG